MEAFQIKDFPDYYITDTGDVYSRTYHPIKNPGTRFKKLKPWVSRYGYCIVDLIKDGKKKHKPVHRLVAETFISNYKEYPEVNHKNGIKTDNRVSNLEWCSYSENLTHAYNVLKRKAPWVNKFGGEHNRSRTVVQIQNRKIVFEFGSLMEAERQTGIGHGGISLCCQGKQKTAGGFEWRYNE